MRIVPMVSVVDDDEVVRVSIGALVRSLGRVARTFASAEDFLNSAEARPWTSGLPALRRIGALDHRPSGPPRLKTASTKEFNQISNRRRVPGDPLPGVRPVSYHNDRSCVKRSLPWIGHRAALWRQRVGDAPERE